MLATNMYYISLERCSYGTSAHVNYIKIHAEMFEILQLKIKVLKLPLLFDSFFSRSLIKYSSYLTHISYKIGDNKSRTSHIRHTQKKYITQ